MERKREVGGRETTRKVRFNMKVQIEFYSCPVYFAE